MPMPNRSEYHHAYYEAHKPEARFRHAKYKTLHGDDLRSYQKAYAHGKSKWARRSIVAWDGEGCNDPDETKAQRYVLFANSEGHYIADEAGLGTLRCLEFLLGHANDEDINVIFGGGYDANQWLGDLDPDSLAALWEFGTVTWKGYKISYKSRKQFTVSHKASRRSACIWDVFGFFQKSFVGVLKEWCPELNTDAMSEMKDARPAFDWSMFDEILAYCLDECELLVRVVNLLFDAFDQADIQLSRYDGAGAVAAALLKKYGVKDYLPEDGDVPAAVQLASQHAYAGGRIEAPQLGYAEHQPIHRNDINSAYPTHIATLPCLAHGRWIQRNGRPTSGSFSMCLVDWSFDERPFYPFFYREHGGSIYFPQMGSGWYWLCEVEAAEESMQLAKRERIGISISYEWVSTCQHKPFEWVPKLYDERLKLKARLAAGDPSGRAEIPIKLGLNSLYGKMAQQVGMVTKDKDGKWIKRRPTYHNLCWAGYVTANTRASLFRVAMQRPSSVIAFSTDAVTTTENVEVKTGKQLGEFTYERFDGIYMAQPGVYFLRPEGKAWATDEAGKAKEAKYRGFDKGVLNRESIIDVLRNGCRDMDCENVGANDHYHAKCTRFVGMGSALVGVESLKRWRTWQAQDRRLSLLPAGKRMPDWHHLDYGHRLQPTLPTPVADPERLSAPYKLEWNNGPADRELEYELSDWYL
jgi:hypothetical protein